MTDWNTLLDAVLNTDKPFTYVLSRILRDNPIAIAEGSAGSPPIAGLNPGIISVAANSTSLTFNSLPEKDVIEFELLGLKPATAGAVLEVQVSIDNGSTWITNYTYTKKIVEVIPAGTVSESKEGAYGDTKISISQVSGGVANGSDTCLSGIFRLFSNGSVTVLKQCTWSLTHANNLTSGTCTVEGGGFIPGVTKAQKINAIKFSFSAGNITNGKTARRERRSTVTN